MEKNWEKIEGTTKGEVGWKSFSLSSFLPVILGSFFAVQLFLNFSFSLQEEGNIGSVVMISVVQIKSS